MTEAQEINRKKLVRSAEKLVELLSLNAPAVIVCGQVSQIFSQCLLAYDESLYAEIGKRARQNKLVASGYCVRCEERCERGPEGLAYPDHCADCREQLESERSPSRN